MKKEEAVRMFSEKIRNHAKRTKVTQSELAGLLEVTPSAISQKFKCSILMSMNELKSICLAMKLTSEETSELQALLAKIRAGESGGTSPFNRYMKNCRRQKNLTINRLGQLCGIAPVRLRAFEEDSSVVFSIEDAEKLGRIYDLDPDFLMSKSPVPAAAQTPYYSDSPDNGGVLELAEPRAPYCQNLRKVAVVDIDEFTSYSNTIDVFTFGEVRSVSEMLYECKRDVVGINIKASVLHQPFPGKYCLLVTDKVPFVHVAQLFLTMDNKRNVYILQRKMDDSKFYFLDVDGGGECSEKHLLWKLAIVDIKFTPEVLV